MEVDNAYVFRDWSAHDGFDEHLTRPYDSRFLHQSISAVWSDYGVVSPLRMDVEVEHPERGAWIRRIDGWHVTRWEHDPRAMDIPVDEI